jgi:hypothetical protein
MTRVTRTAVGIAVAILLVVGAPAAVFAYWSAHGSASLPAHPGTVPGIQADYGSTAKTLADSEGTGLNVPLTLTRTDEREVGVSLHYRLTAPSLDYQVWVRYPSMVGVSCDDHFTWSGMPATADRFTEGSIPTAGMPATTCLSFSATGPTTNTEPVEIQVTVGFAGTLGGWTSAYADQTVTLTIPAQASQLPAAVCAMEDGSMGVTFSGESRGHHLVDEYGNAVGYGNAYPPTYWIPYGFFSASTPSGRVAVEIVDSTTSTPVAQFAVMLDHDAGTVTCAP